MTEEIWAVVPWDSEHEVSSHGRVRSLPRVVSYVDGRSRRYPGQIIRQTTSRGYWNVKMRRQTFRVNRLVLLAFVGPCPEGMESCHDDGDHGNNHLNNLRWDTHLANVRDQSRHGTNARRKQTHCPQGHILDAPNLELHLVRRKGHRNCLACGRARRRLRERGIKAYDKQVFKDLADACYTEILRGDPPPRTHCGNGHELTAANTYIRPGDGQRECRGCTARRAASRTRRRRESAMQVSA